MRRFFRARLVPCQDRVEDEDDASPEIVDEIKAMRFFGISVPEEYGGIGLSMSQECRVVYEFGHTSPAFRSVFGTNVGIGSRLRRVLSGRTR